MKPPRAPRAPRTHRPPHSRGCSTGADHTAAQRELAAFDEAFLDLLHKLYRRATMLVGSRQWAEDAVHEVYLKLAARPQGFLAHPEPYAYAFSTLVSVVRDAWRRERRQVLVDDVEPAAGSGLAWDGGVEGRTAELEAIRLLGHLSVRQAGVVILVDLDGYTIDQAAGILRVHRGTVARTRTRALRKLRGELDPSGERREQRERHEC